MHSEQISQRERNLPRKSGKPQDGFVSRHFNRPISRAITRQLLKTSITPNAWTLLILPLPVLGSLLCARGTYGSVLAGLLVFQLYSILDGCDGEIARAKFLESETGRRLDTLCDGIGMLLLVAGLGLGLDRLLEAFIVAGLIAANEIVLLLNPGAAPANGSSAIYPRHRKLWEHSGIQVFGWVAQFAMQMTKRDVAIIAFIILAAIGQAAWILHLLGATAAAALVLSLVAARRAPGT